MQGLEVSGVVRLIYRLLGVKGLMALVIQDSTVSKWATSDIIASKSVTAVPTVSTNFPVG